MYGSLPSEIQVDPLRGWKWAKIRAILIDEFGTEVKWNPLRPVKQEDQTTRRVYLSGPAYDTVLKVEDKAVCRNYTGTVKVDQHAVPALDCRCGFYALKEPIRCYDGEVLLQVELYGTVIEYEKGFRAEYQRILGGWIWQAPNRVCRKFPSRVGIDADGSLNAACPACVGQFSEQWSMSDLSDVLGVRIQYGWPEHSGVRAPYRAGDRNW